MRVNKKDFRVVYTVSSTIADDHTDFNVTARESHIGIRTLHQQQQSHLNRRLNEETNHDQLLQAQLDGRIDYTHQMSM